ncbi:MAG TPA: ABC transporter permease [Ktedonobacterales bacterium]|jgi:ABC-type transport system involved in multi-copper enzyme maturation permease subunit
MTPGISQQSSFAAPGATGGWLDHTWRLTLWNLKLARRRLMSKILLAILLVGFLLVIGVVFLAVVVISNVDTTAISCPTPVATSQPGDNGVGSDNPCDPATIQQNQQSQQDAKNQELQLLTFPTILGIAGGYTSFMGVVLLCILAGALIGGEYSYGTQRLALSRGVSRAQVLAGQVGALALLALVVSAGMLILGTLLGFVLGPALGASIPAIPADGLLQLLEFWLVIALQLFAYALVALLLGTLARSTAAGIAGSLGYLIFEIIALPILTAIALALSISGSSVGDALQRVQAFFLGPNISALLSGVNRAPLDLGGQNSSSVTSAIAIYVIPPLQGLAVSLLYCILLGVLSYWVLRKRDVTN